MSEQKVDREAWARELALLIEQESKGNKSAFARACGLSSTRSLDRWLARRVNVSEESVRQVARSLNLPVVDLLLKVGYYSTRELPEVAEARTIAEDNEILRTIEKSDAPPSLKRQLTEHVRTQRAAHEQRLHEEVQMILDLTKRGQAS